MRDPLREIERRVRSQVPGPASQYGYALPLQSGKRRIYNGQTLTRFLFDEGVPHDTTTMRELLRLNRIGDPFAELEKGKELMLPPTVNTIKPHREG